MHMSVGGSDEARFTPMRQQSSSIPHASSTLPCLRCSSAVSASASESRRNSKTCPKDREVIIGEPIESSTTRGTSGV